MTRVIGDDFLILPVRASAFYRRVRDD